MTQAPVFPPMLDGRAVAGEDPFAAACDAARTGCDAGLVLYDIGSDRLRAAIVLAPEVPLARAMVMLPLCGVGLQNALGVLVPPEVAVHLEWGGGIRLNGGRCGGFRAAASGRDPDAVPDWLVIGFDLVLWPPEADTGRRPDDTALYAEGCGDVAPGDIVEAWARHMLVWLNTWEEAGNPALHAEWKGLVHGLGEPVEAGGAIGTFLGLDEDFGMILKTDTGTRLVALTALLEETS
jgi:BirA family biotin operon repressor/biotin-[acetyl-CoA-carboxylase] ligase